MDLAHIDGDGALVIRLHADALIAATEASPFLDGYDPDGRGGPLVRVTNAAEWVKSVWYELNRETEDGTTLIHLMFDKAFLRALENGAEGVEIVTKEAPPYPFCRTPDRCAGRGYCPRDPACND